jgi:CHC2 zinc finger/Toprim-like
MAINFPAVRQAHSLASFCHSRGIELKRSGSAGTLVGLCPLHAERTPSFHVYPDEHFNCFGCGAHGDVIALCSKLDGLTVVQAAKRLGSSENYSSPALQTSCVEQKELSITPGNPFGLPYRLNDREQRECVAAAGRLIANDAAIKKLASRRNWKPETIRNLALDLCFGLTLDGKLALLYESGLKLRWEENGERVIRWDFGKKWFWRGWAIKQSHTVYLCEGETDAITLIDAGYETDSRVNVVALPDAWFNIDPFVSLFAGKQVIIATDWDEAGKRAAEKINEALKEVATVLRLEQGGCPPWQRM